MISEITNLTGIAYVSDISDAVIDNIKIVKLTPTSALAVVVTDRGVLKDAMLSTTDDLPEEYTDRLPHSYQCVFGIQA